MVDAGRGRNYHQADEGSCWAWITIRWWIRLSLEQFTAEYGAVGILIINSVFMVLSRKRMKCPIYIRDELLPQVEDFMDVRLLFTSEQRGEQAIDKWTVVVVQTSDKNDSCASVG